MPHIGQPRKYVKIFKLIHFNKSKIERETQREREGGDIENPFEMQPAWILPHWPVGNRNICTKAGPEKETTELAQLSSAWTWTWTWIASIFVWLAGEIRLQIYVNLEHDTGTGTGTGSSSSCLDCQLAMSLGCLEVKVNHALLHDH